MKDNDNHITTKQDETIEKWMIRILGAHLDGTYDIQYRCQKTNWYSVEEKHNWDFYANEYRIVTARRYTIRIDKDGTPEIIKTNDNFSLDGAFYGSQSDGSTVFVMEEVTY